MEQFTIVVADTQGVVRSWDAEAEAMFGYPADEAVGRALDFLIPEDFRDVHWNAFRALMADASADQPLDRGAAILPAQRHDGALLRVAVRLMLLRDPWGRPVGAAAAFMQPSSAPEGAEPLEEV